MRRSSTVRWLLACAGSALLLSAVVLGLMHARGPASPRPEEEPGAEPAAEACELPMPQLLPADADAEHPPLILWAVGGTRLFIDDRATFSPPEAPKLFAPGTYTLRVEAEGQAPVRTRFRLDPWQPGLFHAEVDEKVGIVLLGVGVVCESCEPPLTPLTLASAGGSAGAEAALHLEEAAAALRADDWHGAAQALSRLSSSSRRAPLARKLVAATYLRASSPEPARAELATLTTKEDPDLPALLRRLDLLKQAARTRREEVTVHRWNRLTLQHAALVRLASQKPALSVTEEAARMEEASGRFGEATAQKDALGQAEALEDARAAATSLLKKLAEEDCEARARVVAALAEVGT